MYTIYNCYVKENFAWRVANVQDERIELLVSQYQKVRVNVETLVGGQTIYMTIDLNENLHLLTPLERKLTLIEWITSLTEQSLVGVKEAIDPKSAHSVTMRDSFYYSLKIDVGNHLFGPGNPIPYGEDKDLILTSNPNIPEFDVRHVTKLKDNALFAINGQLCRHYWLFDQIYLIDGHSKLNASRDNVISVIDFNDVGGFDIVGFTADNIKVATQSATDKLKRQTRVLVTLPMTVSGYTPIMVYDGHLCILDGSYKTVSANQIQLTLNHDTLIRRAMRYPFNRLDWLDPANVRLNGIRTDRFYAAEYLTQTDSFIVMVRTSDLSILREELAPTGLHGCYTHYRMPKGIGFFEDYTLAPYMSDGHNQHKVSLQTIDNRRINYALWELPTDNKVLPTTGHTRRGSAELMSAFVLELYVF